uniref:Radial spoke head 3 homolog n=1 Tax=Nothobranchius pienaari TaxID=704102 RepID=A0A1A8N0F5_9TELE
MNRVSQSRVDPNGLFIFSSRPRPVESCSKPKETPLRPVILSQRHYDNIMDDRQFVRRHAQHTIPTKAQQPSAGIRRQVAIARKRAIVQADPGNPKPLQGRLHSDVQTELYLEELSDVITTTDIECQTDDFIDRPRTPLYIPTKSGKDAETQIEDGELFDFDSEVQPVLEFLVGKTIEQSLLEVLEEEELATLRAQQRAFRELRNNELAEVQRLQEQERRRKEEKERRVAQQRERLRMEKETIEKITARVFSQQYLAGLLPAVFSSLRRDGFFYDPVERDIEMDFLPWLMAEVHSRLEERNSMRSLLDTMISEVSGKNLKEWKDQETQPARSTP